MNNAFSESGIFLIQTFGGLYLYIMLFRLLLPLVRADFYNPLSQFVVKATQYPLAPVRKILPTVGRLDLACLVLAIAIQWAILCAIYAMAGAPYTIMGLLVPSPFLLAYKLLNIFFYGIIGSIIISWVAPYSHHPAVSLIRQVTEPVMAPFRKVLPPMGGLDLSPMLAMAAIYVCQIFLRSLMSG